MNVHAQSLGQCLASGHGHPKHGCMCLVDTTPITCCSGTHTGRSYCYILIGYAACHLASMQVCSLLWNPYEKELLSGLDGTESQLRLWKWPSMHHVTDLLDHTQRVLHLTLSPDGCTVCRCVHSPEQRFMPLLCEKLSSCLVAPACPVHCTCHKQSRSFGTANSHHDSFMEWHPSVTYVDLSSNRPQDQPILCACSGSADETLKFWKIFQKPFKENKGQGLTGRSDSVLRSVGIR
jgi:WD40 repeat protein